MSLHSNLSPETTSRPTRPVARWLRRSALVVASVAVLIAGCVGIHAVSARSCSPPDPARHDLACDIPLPAGAVFQRHDTSDYRGDPPCCTGTQDTWALSVPPSGVEALFAFYHRRLPALGWRCVGQDNRYIYGWSDGDLLHPDRSVGVWIPDAVPGAVLTISVITYSSGDRPSGC